MFRSSKVTSLPIRWFVGFNRFLPGRNFPNQSGSWQLAVDARFDGEILITDPVELTSTPDINQELAWELDKKTFQHHKLQRSVIKCNAYATRSTGERDNLGYFILQVRPLTNTQVCFSRDRRRTYHHRLARSFVLRKFVGIRCYRRNIRSWNRRLVFAPTSKMIRRPEVRHQRRKRVRIIGDVGQSVHVSLISILAKTPSTTGGTSATSTRSKQLQPVLLEDKGYYQLGPDVSTAEIFSLSITLYSAKNLVHVRILILLLLLKIASLSSSRLMQTWILRTVTSSSMPCLATTLHRRHSRI